MTGWSELLATALVGTARRAHHAAAGRAAGAQAAGDHADPATALLDEAAAHSVYRRAGARPVTGLPEPDPAPPETMPLVGAAAAARITDLVDNGGYLGDVGAALVREWLTTAAARGRRVPPEAIPGLLDAGRREPSLAPLIASVGGTRAGWLAVQNAEWAYLARSNRLTDAAAVPDVNTWYEGAVEQRADFLAAARRADPPAARQLLAEDWPSLLADERARLLGSLATGLGPEDEDFLEHALDDRRKEVRTVAADLLLRLPDSAYTRRLVAEARVSLRLRDGVLIVDPPTELPDDLRRVGVSAKPPGRMGERAWWFEELVARVPLAAWTTDRYGPPRAASPSDFLALSIADGWAPAVLESLARAATSQRDSAWASALLDAVEPQLPTLPSARHWLIARLHETLAPEDAVRRAIAAMRDPEARLGRLIEQLVAACPVPWPDALARAVLSGLEAHARHRRMPYLLDSVFRLAELRMPPHFAEEVDRMTGRFRAAMPGHGRVYNFEMLAMTLHLRHEMIQELA